MLCMFVLLVGCWLFVVGGCNVHSVVLEFVVVVIDVFVWCRSCC